MAEGNGESSWLYSSTDDSLVHRAHDAPPMSPIPETTPILKKPLSTRNLYSFDVKWGVIPPAELEIIRMKKESQSMFAKKKQHQNDSCSHGLGDIPIFTSSDRLEDEMVKATEPGAVEAWVNAHLLKGAIQLIPLSDAYIDASMSDEKKKQAMMYQSKLEYNDIQTIFASPDKSPLEGAGIDSGSLLRLGMPKAIVERIYRGLFVYSSGFHSLIHDIGRHCPAYAESHIAANIWLTFLHLLEKCEDGRYEMAMLKFNHATAVWKRNAISEYEQQEQTLKAAVDVAKAETEAQKDIVREREAVIAARDQTIQALKKEVAEAHECTAQTEDQVRLANLEILELENTLARTRKELDQTMQSLHIALSEKTNLEVEVTSYQNELQNSEARVKKAHEMKIKTAERIRELQATAQELRDQLEKSKNDLNISAMDQAKTSLENDELLRRTEMLETKVKSLTAHLFTLTTDLNKRTTEVEERDATLLSLKQAMEKDRENFAGQTAEIARLNALVAAQKRDYMVLEAQAQLLLMEKKNSNMREGDRLRIERLLNKKVELEKEVEGLRLEKEKSQEHIWNLRAALETLENDLHLSKRAFATSQTSLQQLDKVNDQLRNQLQEMERNVDRMTVGFNAMKDRCKMVEDAAKEQIDKVEMELKVAMAQMREMAYVRRENESQINDLAKTIDVHIMENKIMRQRYEQSEKVTASLVIERDSLLREKRVIQLEYNANQLVMTKLQESTSSLMGRIRKHEVTFDEAISELKVHYEEALSVGHKHLEPSLQSEPQMSLPNKFAADVMHNSVVTVMSLMEMKNENPSFQVSKRRRSIKASEMKQQCEYRIVELGNEITKREQQRLELERQIYLRDQRIYHEQCTVLKERAIGKMFEERCELAREDLIARVLQFRHFEQFTTRKIMDKDFELYNYKNRVASLRNRVAQLLLMLDQSGMAEEDAAGYLKIVKYKFHTRKDEAIQAVEDMSENSTQTYPPRRSPVKERAKIKEMDMTSPESVLGNITNLIPDEQLDHHFFSLTHHAVEKSQHYEQGHLISRMGRFSATHGAVLPKLSQNSLQKPSSHKKPSRHHSPHRRLVSNNGQTHLRTNVIADFRNHFGHHERVAMPQIGPFLVSRPYSEDTTSIDTSSTSPYAKYTQEITENDYNDHDEPEPIVHVKKQSSPRKISQHQPPTPTPSLPKAPGRSKPHASRRPRREPSTIAAPEGSMEYEVARLDALNAAEPVYRILPSHTDAYQVSSDSDDEERVEDYFTTENGILTQKKEEAGRAHVPSLLEINVQRYQHAQKLGKEEPQL